MGLIDTLLLKAGDKNTPTADPEEGPTIYPEKGLQLTLRRASDFCGHLIPRKNKVKKNLYKRQETFCKLGGDYVGRVIPLIAATKASKKI
jgi:hypothetical protein